MQMLVIAESNEDSPENQSMSINKIWNIKRQFLKLFTSSAGEPGELRKLYKGSFI